ncbi:MAG: carbohydrate binding family 9 domain-containing protein, partial [Rhodothermales bacterium]|nr:carbohydrate binding family 9 domain-containing protein [Rhodothermales bacterium]
MTILYLTLAILTFQQVPQQYDGRKGNTVVDIPRIESKISVDGVLDETEWQSAVVLSGFSQYQPVDGRPASDSTEVLVFYSPNAMYFGIRAFERHGDVVRATRANRDNIASEDNIQILLDTYGDARSAYVFSVNPLGVQADGTRSDRSGGGAGGRSATGGGTSSINFLDGNVDLNPDFEFQSQGQLTDDGYVVEVRIPFKSLRYQEGPDQHWGIHILRRVQHSGFQDSWAPVVRASASFLGQAGSITGLSDLDRGLVLDIIPSATARLDGSANDGGDWEYDSGGRLSGDVRWGVTEELTLSGTINPDFSQVEADVGQVVLNERFALFFPEKRPFFLDGIELLETPSQLIYTRRIIAPEAGVKLGGKVGALNAAAIVAVEDNQYSSSGDDNPVFAIARLRGNATEDITVGAVLTTREDVSDYSRLAGADIRMNHHGKYFLELQAVQSWTEVDGSAVSGPLFEATWDRTGRSWGFNYSVEGVAPDFRAAAGFVNRTGTVDARASNRLTAYGAEGAVFETYGAFGTVARTWNYDDISAGPIEGRESLSPSATLRGGWSLRGSFGREFYGFDPNDYADYTILTAPEDTSTFVIPGKEDNQYGGSLSVTSPTFQYFTATGRIGIEDTPVFREASGGSSLSLSATIDLRPTNALRTTFQVTRFQLNRDLDDSRFSTETIPRLKIEYQITPAIFIRFIGQYASRERAPLLDRNGNSILVDGEVDTGNTSNNISADWLFSYRPTPGTLLYLGYGTLLEDAGQQRFRSV